MAFPAKYQKDFPEKLINYMKQGYSFEAFGAYVGATRTALYKWLDKYPKFAEAYDYAQLLSQAYFEKLKLAKTAGQPIKDFDPKLCDGSLISFTLSTRFYKTYGRKDKLDHSSEDGSMTPQEQTVIIIPKNNREKD